jgi:hypothetical protein
MQDFRERFFYHSFPRRGASTAAEIDKGKKILTAICDFGFVLTPQFIEWTQPTIVGSPRTLPVLQKRVCFTEPSPKEWRDMPRDSGNSVSSLKSRQCVS